MDRLPRRDPSDSIVDKGPIIINTDLPTGYTGIRTTVEIRDHRNRDADDNREFYVDAVINTEVRRGRWTSKGSKYQEQVTADHHRAIALLLEAIKAAAE